MRLESLPAFFAGVVITLYCLLIAYGYGISFDWLQNYQTLVTGITATLAALVTVYVISRQISQTADLESENRRRRNFAARAALSQPLSNLMGIQRQIINQISSALTSAKGADAKINFDEVPLISETDLRFLINCIIDAEARPADELSKLLAELQVQSARLDRKDDPMGSEYKKLEQKRKFETHLIDALFIHARSGKLLYYARREDREFEGFTFKSAVENSFSITGTKCALRDYVTVSNDSFEERLARHILRAES